MADKKTKYDKFFMNKKTFWEEAKPSEVKAAFKVAEEYKNFLAKAKVEREAVEEIEKYAKKNKIRYFKNNEKSIILVKKGKEKLAKGVKIVASHIDSPRLDLKPYPLFEDEELGLLKTHYYGGIKKYQWVNHPLALHGVVVLKGGKKVKIEIGEKENEPVFTVADLLPHLADKKQGERKLFAGIEGEEINILCGSIPVKEKEVKEKVKAALLEKLNKEYGLKETDFAAAEIQAVPAGKPRDLGFDSSMIAGYGQDDKSCAFASLKAGVEAKNKKTILIVFYDKEEIGSTGVTGAQSRFVERVIEELIKESKEKTTLLEVMNNSEAISADVTAGVNPTYKDVMDLHNATRIGKGIALEKTTGYRGKYDGSEAPAEYMRKIIDLLDKNKVKWQAGELGKVDEGGGGTIAKYLAHYGVKILDAGLPVLSMHSPLEVASKADLYETYKAYKVFLESN